MLDNVIVNAYLDAAGRLALKNRAQEADGASGVSVYVLSKFRADVEATRENLEFIANNLKKDGNPMTHVRIIEVAAWMSVAPVGYYRSG